MNICIITSISTNKQLNLSHRILYHWTFLLCHRSNLHYDSSPEQDTIPPVFQLQPSHLELTKWPHKKWVMPIYMCLQSSQFNLPWSHKTRRSPLLLLSHRDSSHKITVLILHFNLSFLNTSLLLPAWKIVNLYRQWTTPVLTELH